MRMKLVSSRSQITSLGLRCSAGHREQYQHVTLEGEWCGRLLTSWAESYPVGLAKAITSCLEVMTVVNEVARAPGSQLDVSNLLLDDADLPVPCSVFDAASSDLCCGTCNSCSGDDCDLDFERNFAAEVDDCDTSRFLRPTSTEGVHPVPAPAADAANAGFWLPQQHVPPAG